MTNSEKKEYVHFLTDYNLFIIKHSLYSELNAFQKLLLFFHLCDMKCRYILRKGLFSWRRFTKKDWSE